MLKLKLQYFGHLMRRVDSLEKTLMLGGIGGKRRRGRQRMRWLDGITTRWTWVWVNSGCLWWTGRPGVLQFMGSQRVGQDWATELNWNEVLVSYLTDLQNQSSILTVCLLSPSVFSHITWRKSLLLCFLLPSAEYLRTMLFLTSYRSLSPLFLIIIILLYYLSSTIIKSLLNTYFKIFLKNHNKLQYCMIYTKPEITYQTFVSCWPTAAAAKLLQLCLTLCDLIDGIPPGFPIPGILQARTLEWVAISFSNAWK